MADTFQFDLVSPERRLASLEVNAVQIPGAEGDMTAMPDHAPIITTLRPGILSVEAPGETSDYVVFGGFAQITGDGISVLAEKAVPVGELTRAELDAMVEEARTRLEAVRASDQPHGLVDDAVKLLADMEALGTHINL